MGSQRSVLIVEDDPGLQRQLRWSIPDGIEVDLADTAEAVEEVIRRNEPQVVTLDLGLPPDPGGVEEGFRVLGSILELAPATKVIVITGQEDSEHAVRAVAAGAFDYYQKPLEVETFRFAVERALRIHALEAEVRRLQSAGASPIDGIIATSDPMLRVCRQVEKVGPTDLTVLIEGETGTGKELIARGLHALSQREAGPFVAINCAAIPENLLESELFGYEKGAFTGASKRKKGKIEHAHGGTLFLDEIGDMPLPLQSKMLRFLQERAVDRIGGQNPVDVDVRVVSATHRDLDALTSAGEFREDLYYRLAEITVSIPPLRDRDGDAVLIANALLRRFAAEFDVGKMSFSKDAIDAIAAWHWPGNVREMENRIKRAVVLAEGAQITAHDLELAPVDGALRPLNLREVREEAERNAVLQALASTNSNITQAARLLGITRPTLYSMMERFGIG